VKNDTSAKRKSALRKKGFRHLTAAFFAEHAALVLHKTYRRRTAAVQLVQYLRRSTPAGVKSQNIILSRNNLRVFDRIYGLIRRKQHLTIRKILIWYDTSHPGPNLTGLLLAVQQHHAKIRHVVHLSTCQVTKISSQLNVSCTHVNSARFAKQQQRWCCCSATLIVQPVDQ